MQDSSSPPSSAPSKNETLRGSPPAPSPDPEPKTSPSPKSKSKRPPLSPPPPSNSPSSQEPISPIPEDGSASAPPPKNAIATPPTQEEEGSNSLSPPFLPPPPPAPPPPKSSSSPLPPFSSMPPLPPPSTPLLSGPPPPSPPPPPPNDDDGDDDDDDVGVVDKSRNPSSNSTSPKKKKFYPPPSPPPPPPTTTTMALPPIASPILTVPPPPPPPPPQTASNLPITQHPSPLSPPSPTQAITPAAPWPSSSQTASSTTPPDATSSTRSTAPRPHVSTDTATPRPWVSTSSDTASPTMPSTSSDSRQAEDSEPLNHPPKEPGSFSPTPPTTEGGSSNAKHKDHNANLYIGLGVTGLAILLIVIAFVVLKRKRSKADAAGGHYRPPGVSTLRSVDGCYYDHGNAGGFSGSGDPYYAKKPSSAPPPGPGYSNGSCLGQGYAPGPPDPTGTRSWFTYEELMEITDGFSKENLIGEGGFGCVYKGWLLDGRRVAVKQLKAGSGQGDREFRAEVEIISRVHHRHLVSLVGYCIAEYHRLLVYEFVPNNTLEHHLHGKGLPVMDWTKRMRIAIGSARGLAYLHEDCHPRIIHRDIKSANILLDEYFEAQVADFGLAKLSDDANTHVSTRVMGTFGYMAPEYASSGKLTDRSDVFSFGVVLLEIITGRKPVDASQPLGDESLVEWARPHLVNALETGNIDELVDPRLESNFSRGEMIGMIEVAAACVRHSAPKRPRMVQVVRALDNDGELADLTNGVKFGQSTVYDSTQYSADIQKFRMMAYGSGLYSSEDGSSREYESKSTEFSGDSTESVQRPLNPQRPAQNITGQYMHQGRGFN